MKAVILVGGKGTRLRPLTFRTPKQLLPLVNRVFLEFVLDRCLAAGMEEIIISTGYLPRFFEERFPGGSYRGMRLVCVPEDTPLDTAGGVKNCQEHLDDTFVVFNGDVLSGLDLTDMVTFHREKGAAATIYLKAVEDPTPFGLVPIDRKHRVIDFFEKPEREEDIPDHLLTGEYLINAGCYVLEPSVLELVPPATPYSMERGLFPALLESDELVYGYPSDAYWLDTGTPALYLQAHADILEGALAWTPPGREVSPGLRVGAGVVVDPTAKVAGPIVLGDVVVIAPDVVLEGPLVVGPGVKVGEGSRLARSVVHAGAEIGRRCDIDGSIVGEEAILRDRVHVADCSVVGPGAEVEPENELRRGVRIWPDVVVPEGSIKF